MVKPLRWIGGVMLLLMWAMAAQAATIGLTAIEVNGDKMVNDSVLDVTWADVTPNSTTGWAYPSVDFYVPGNSVAATYVNSAQAWITYLNIENYGGNSDWRLASDNSAYNDHNCTHYSLDEMGCLFYNELGATFPNPLIEFGPFANLIHSQIIEQNLYWSGTEYNTSVYPSGFHAWIFSANNSSVGYSLEHNEFEALAVRSGQTLEAPPPVAPIPATLWLLSSSVGGLGAFARRRKAWLSNSCLVAND